jgi:hypothetical protein
MPETQSPRPDSDLNLLFGILALQMDFINRDALVDAMNSWVLNKGKPLGRILLEQGKLSQDLLQLMDAIVAAHLKTHQQDARQSLAALSSVGSASHALAGIADPDLQASLAVAGSGAIHEAVTTGPALRSAASLAAAIRYRILRPHARGGLGEVFVARDEELNREVALKEIQPEHAGEPVLLNEGLLANVRTGISRLVCPSSSGHFWQQPMRKREGRQSNCPSVRRRSSL